MQFRNKEVDEQPDINTLHLFIFNIFGQETTLKKLFLSAIKSIFAFFVFSTIFCLALTSLFFIDEGEQAVLIEFGKITGPVFNAGIHLKAPYPFASVRKFDVGKVRRLHAGSHKPLTEDGSVFKEDVLLLWGSMHGVSDDELMIAAAPRQLIRNAVESGGKMDAMTDKTPSVSLVGVDVVVEYVISDCKMYCSSVFRPDSMLMTICESEVFRCMLAYDIDFLLSQGRSQLSDILPDAISRRCNAAGMGIGIIAVGVTALHPPTNIAEVFEENVSSLQEVETKIQQAHQTATRIKTETVGSEKLFDSIIVCINMEEQEILARNTTEKLLVSCGGEISRILAEASAYRWSREHIEHGKADKYREELNLYKTAKDVYRHERYFKVLEEALSVKRKILLSKSCQNVFMETGIGVKRLRNGMKDMGR